MEKALQLAEEALSHGEFPVGAVMVYKNEIIATGSRRGSSGGTPDEINHAEMICLRDSVDLGRGIDRLKTTLFCTLEPCLMCFGAIILSGTGRIVYAYEDIMGGGTRCDLEKLTPLYKNSTISILPGILREESLKLFKDFFANPKNNYWKKSLLSAYTLQQ
ncbi:MAG: nucleoside deaminase [Desulfosarcina sp.]|nr:nucleoside deaminase [Desulfobacterales bacterium]